MSTKPDFGLKLMEQGDGDDVDYNCYDCQLFRLTVLGDSQYSTTIDSNVAGEMYTLRLDFNAQQLDEILSNASPETTTFLHNDIAEDPSTPRTILFECDVPFGVRARLGNPQVGDFETVVPLVALEILPPNAFERPPSKLTQSDEVAEVGYYQDDDADFIHACLGKMGYGGILRIRTPLTKQSQWEWIQRGTDLWDTLHQRIYRNFRATHLEDSALPALPPLPDASTEPPRYQDPTSFPATDYPHLGRLLEADESATARFVAVLGEDTYESSMGDGEFHDLEYIGKTDQDAQDYIAKQKQLPDAGYSDYHVRRLSLKLVKTMINCDLQKEVFDHCDLKKALQSAEAWAESKRRQGK